MDSSAPRGPPDVPPRNPAMSRLNGRLPGSHAASDHERDPELEPSCLVRTPSGNFYNIPSESAQTGIVESDLLAGGEEARLARGREGKESGRVRGKRFSPFSFVAQKYFGQSGIAPREAKTRVTQFPSLAILQISRPNILITSPAS